MFAYLPKLLTSVHDLDKPDAAARAAGFALVAVVARPIGGWLSDRFGADQVLRVSFAGTVVLATLLGPFYEDMVPLTILALTLAAAFGLGTGAVFKLVAQDFPDRVGAVTGLVGAAGGLGGFFPPLVMAAVNSITGSYLLGFLLLALAALACLVLLETRRRGRQTRPSAVPA
jgi:NNP family nitrate/nitrite transporter-like MFS transporter